MKKDGKITRWQDAKKYKDAEQKRLEKIAYYESINSCVIPTKGIDSGAKGKAFEISLTREGSLKVGVAKQGKVDNYFSYNGKATSYEAKTGGGIIAGLYRKLERGEDGFVVYMLDVCNSGTQYMRRVINPIILRISDFVNCLEECGAIAPNSRTGEPCIVKTSKKMYLRLSEYPIAFDSNKSYTSADFDGLEV